MRDDSEDIEQIELIEEIELSEPVGISKVQLRDAIKIRSVVQIEAGNASSRCVGGSPILAETREVSPKRFRAVAAGPLQVGDSYIVKFDSEALPLPEAYVLCVGCRLLSDRQFESQFEFFVPVDLRCVPDFHE
jgi:hypothetical protein